MRDDYTNYVNECAYKYIRALVREMIILIFFFFTFWQDEVRLRLFLDSIGLSDLSAKEIKKWMPEDRRQFEIIQERLVFVLFTLVLLACLLFLTS